MTCAERRHAGILRRCHPHSVHDADIPRVRHGTLEPGEIFDHFQDRFRASGTDTVVAEVSDFTSKRFRNFGFVYLCSRFRYHDPRILTVNWHLVCDTSSGFGVRLDEWRCVHVSSKCKVASAQTVRVESTVAERINVFVITYEVELPTVDRCARASRLL
jgi:hypothetical protein